ncbi:MAG TPA: phosphate signaling complex protein PhoU [Chthoniobacterales bacterium]|jgi:phosphate transport system protein
MPEYSRHIIANFDAALTSLRNDVLMMSSLAEVNLQNAVNGLLKRDSDLCNVAIADDEEIDQLEKQVDKDGIDIMLRYQPVATDLRRVVSAMKLSSNLERVADQAVNIARRAKKLNQFAELPESKDLEPLFLAASSILRDSLRAFTDDDTDLALSLKARDKELDAMNREFISGITDQMAKHPEQIKGYLDLIFISRFLERVGDHATNIAEDAVWAVQAEDIRHTYNAAK